jgi:hypothetical protein
MIFRASAGCDLVLTGGGLHSRIHIRNQADPQHMLDIAGDKLTGKTADDQVVFGKDFCQGHPKVRQRTLPFTGQPVEYRFLS